jgi:hypothetical protein
MGARLRLERGLNERLHGELRSFGRRPEIMAGVHVRMRGVIVIFPSLPLEFLSL